MAKRIPQPTSDMELVPTSLRLSQIAETLRTKLAAKLGINKTAVIELAIREFAEKHHVTVEDK